MTINYGKRDPGGLTAASPGDTLYVPFATFNDSGASIGIGGTLAVTDIEILKNGNAIPRATDSGYSLISDTGQYGNLVGLHRFSISLFNTSDDTGFFDVGSQYHVAVDSITVDGRIVRFFPAVFEIGTPRANVVEIVGDTGAATHVAQMADEYDTGRLPAEATATLDTGGVSNAVWNSTRAAHVVAGTFGQYVTANADLLDGDTGYATQLGKFAGLQLAADGTLDTGTGLHDTGAVATAVWSKDIRSVTDVTGFSDTGINERLAAIEAHTDTGIQTGLSVNVAKIDGDTGFADRIGKFASVLSASGQVDTGTLAGTQPGTIDANILYVNSTQITGIGDTGAGDTWRPA